MAAQQRQRFWPPRRQAAIQAQRRNFKIAKDRVDKPAPLGPAPAPRPVAPAPTYPDCIHCHRDILPGQETEKCQNCKRLAHHGCMEQILVPYHRLCRGLCGHQPQQVVNNANAPTAAAAAAVGVNCPACQSPFRLDLQATRDRWLEIFATRRWQTYVNRLARHPHRMQPSIDRGNTHFGMVYQPDESYFVRRNHPHLIRDIVDPSLLVHGGVWNQANGPFHLRQAAWDFFRNRVLQNLESPDLRPDQWFIVHPSDTNVFRDDDARQLYMFSELNYLMHDTRRTGWVKFARLFDDHDVTSNMLAQM